MARSLAQRPAKLRSTRSSACFSLADADLGALREAAELGPDPVMFEHDRMAPECCILWRQWTQRFALSCAADLELYAGGQLLISNCRVSPPRSTTTVAAPTPLPAVVRQQHF